MRLRTQKNRNGAGVRLWWVAGATLFGLASAFFGIRLHNAHALSYLPIQLDREGRVVSAGFLEARLSHGGVSQGDRLVSINGDPIPAGGWPRVRLGDSVFRRRALEFQAGDETRWILWTPGPGPKGLDPHDLVGLVAALEPILESLPAELIPTLKLERISNRTPEEFQRTGWPIRAASSFTFSAPRVTVVVCSAGLDPWRQWTLLAIGVLVGWIGLAVAYVRPFSLTARRFLLFALLLSMLHLLRSMPAYLRPSIQFNAVYLCMTLLFHAFLAFTFQFLGIDSPRLRRWRGRSLLFFCALWAAFTAAGLSWMYFAGWSLISSVAAIVLLLAPSFPPFSRRFPLRNRHAFKFFRMAMLVSFTPILVALIVRSVHPTWLFSSRFLSEPGIFFPLIMGAGILRQNLLGVEGVTRDLFRSLVRSLLGGAAYVAVFALALMGAVELLPARALPPAFALLGLVSFLFAPALARLRRRAELENGPSASGGDWRPESPSESVPLDSAVLDLAHRLSKALFVPEVRVAIDAPGGDTGFISTIPHAGNPPLSPEEIVAWFTWARSLPAGPTSMDTLADDVRLSASAEFQRLAQWDARWVVPLRTEADFLGVALLGPKAGLAAYSLEDLARISEWARICADTLQAGAVRSERSTRERAEATLRETERRLRILAENARDVIFRIVIQPRLRCDYISPAARQVTGRPPEIFFGSPFLLRRLFDTHDWNRLLVLARATGSDLCELRILHADGSFRWVDIRLTAERDASGATVAIEGIARDITERKRVEAERAILESQMRQSQKLEALGTLAAGIAHDFNNALSVIQLHAARAAEPGATADSLRHLDSAVTQARSISKSLMAYSRGAPIEKSWAPLGELIERAFRIQRRLFPANVEFDLRMAPEAAPVLVHADEGQIHQALLNFLINARDAMPDGGGVRLSVDWNPAQTAAASSEAEGQAIITISDTGGGIPEEALGRIFEPFFSTKLDGQGAGLGLAMAHGIITAHGGSIRVQSRPGEGTSFTITLPARESRARIDTPDGDKRRACSLRSNVVVAIANEYARAAAAARLADAGFSPRTVATTAELMDLAQQLESERALVIYDLDLPAGDSSGGLDPSLLAGGGALLVLASADGELKAASFGEVLLKPFDLDTLVGKVADALSRMDLQPLAVEPRAVS